MYGFVNCAKQKKDGGGISTSNPVSKFRVEKEVDKGTGRRSTKDTHHMFHAQVSHNFLHPHKILKCIN